MNRNYFLQRHEEELAHAKAADCDASRQAHEELARQFKEAADAQAPVTGVNDPTEERQLGT